MVYYNYHKVELISVTWNWNAME